MLYQYWWQTLLTLLSWRTLLAGLADSADLADSGWRTRRTFIGGLWRTLASSGGLWRTLADAGGLWVTPAGPRRPATPRGTGGTRTARGSPQSVRPVSPVSFLATLDLPLPLVGRADLADSAGGLWRVLASTCENKRVV